MKHMSWGTKIVLLYCGFILMILTLVFFTLHQDIQLVSDDYYEQELKYQDRIDASKNSQDLRQVISFDAHNGQVIISYPKDFAAKKLEGNILFLRPSDSSLDIKTSIQLNDSAQQTVIFKKFKKGLYKAQLTWTLNNKQYYVEESIFMN